MTIGNIIQQRKSSNNFNPNATLSIEEIEELLFYATQAPSCYNIQHWRFYAVTNKEKKKQLKAISYNQQKVEDAAVVFVVAADIKGYENLGQALQPLVEAGAMDQQSLDGMAASVAANFEKNDQAARDEAIRSASFAAMCLMLAAEEKGWATGAMIGFDADGVSKFCGLKDQEIPVVMIACGPEAEGNHPKKPRFPVNQLYKIV